MSELNNTLRIIAIEDDILKEMNKFKKNLYFSNPYLSWDKINERFYTHFVLDLGYSPQIVREGIKMLSNNQKRRTRCLDKTTTLVNDNKTVYFGTLTFRDDVLNKTSSETRRKYVSRYLKSISSSYIANVDYGDKIKNPQSNEREHYRCLIAVDSIPVSWEYGFCKFLEVRKDDEDKKRISKYIAKLTNHAMKVEKTGKAKRIIYSRGVVIPYWLLE